MEHEVLSADVAPRKAAASDPIDPQKRQQRDRPATRLSWKLGSLRAVPSSIAAETGVAWLRVTHRKAASWLARYPWGGKQASFGFRTTWLIDSKYGLTPKRA